MVTEMGNHCNHHQFPALCRELEFPYSETRFLVVKGGIYSTICKLYWWN